MTDHYDQREALHEAKKASIRSLEVCNLFQKGEHSTEPKGVNPWQLVDKFESPQFGPMLHYRAFCEDVFVTMSNGQPLINYTLDDKRKALLSGA